MNSWTSKEIILQKSELIKGYALVDEYGVQRAAEELTKESGILCTYSVMRYAYKKLGLNQSAKKADHIEIEEKDISEETEIPIQELIQQRIKANKRKKAKYSKHYRTISLKPEPIGLLIFGDPHVDNDGCDWSVLYEHILLAQSTEGILACSVGDQLDNWIGRLGRLYSNTSMLASDGWRLSEWMFSALQWLAVIGGNHDTWASSAGIDPMSWLTKKCGVRFYCNDELRINIEWKDRPELEPVILYLRHFFKGHSWFHPTHGSNKESMLDGKAHILASGHVHNWAYLQTEMRHGRISHCLSVRGYKRYDSFAKQKGFYEQQSGYAALVVIDPEKEDHRIQVFWDIEEGCNYLTYLRTK